MRVLALALALAPALAQPAPAPAQAASAASPAASQPADRPAYESDPRFVDAMTQARKDRLARQYDDAASQYRKAVKLSAGTCRRCLNDLYAMQMAAGTFKDAAATASQLTRLADTPRERSLANGKLGEALYRQAGDKPRPAQLQAAHAALAAAVADLPGNLAARWTDGCVLARLGRTAEASDQFSHCALEAPVGDPMRQRAQHFAENPGLSLLRLAPPFELTALDGSRLTLDALAGKVVLLDFWATWCGPCNAELPHLKQLAKQFAGEPFVIISISRDEDETAWRAFVSKHEMSWPQYRDRDNQLSQAFQVNALPDYFTIDADGVLTSQLMGAGQDVEGRLRKLIRRAREAHPLPAPVASN